MERKLMPDNRIRPSSHALPLLPHPRRVYPFRFRGLRGQVFLIRVALSPEGGLDPHFEKMFAVFCSEWLQFSYVEPLDESGLFKSVSCRD